MRYILFELEKRVVNILQNQELINSYIFPGAEERLNNYYRADTYFQAEFRCCIKKYRKP